MGTSLNLKPSTWPQKPLLLTPTENSATKIIGIRYISEKEYLVPWKSNNNEVCYHIPINNGNEEKGKSLVVDFRSNCFAGTMLIRVSDIEPILIGEIENKKIKDENKTSYFHSRKRTFQTIIQGYFLNNNYPMSSSMTGQIFHPTADSTNAKKSSNFLINSAIKFFKVLSPQLNVQWDSERIHFLSPLNSTAQSIHVYDKEKENNDGKSIIMTFNNTLEDWDLEEPLLNDRNSIFNHHTFSNTLSSHQQQQSDKSTTQQHQDPRMYRKKIFDALTRQSKKKKSNLNDKKNNDNNNEEKSTTESFFDTNKIYSFQFYQHLLNLNEYKLEIPIYVPGASKKINLSNYLYGQPLKIYAGCGDDNTFWSFDIWHDSLITNNNH